MKVLLIQENGRHEKNKLFRECFCLQRAFLKLNVTADVWGLGHENYAKNINFNTYDLIINLENYGTGWEPDLSNVNSKKLLWSIDAHVKGEEPYLYEFNRGKYNLLLHSTYDFVNESYKVWFPNAYDDTLIFNKNLTPKWDVGFCGSLLNRQTYINKLQNRYNFKHDNFVIGDDMVNAVNSYKIHWNLNIANDINYRSFETVGMGVPLITNYNPQYIALSFEHGKNVMFYRNDDELFNNIDLLLRDDMLRESLKKESLELAKKHTYLKRAAFLLKLYNKL